MIRVLRMIEYTFADNETAEAVLARMTMSLKTPTMTMKSAIVTDLTWVESVDQAKEES
jgi:hypothetical protein